MQENNTPRRRRSETFRDDALPESRTAAPGTAGGNSGKAPLTPPSSVPRPGSEYRYVPPAEGKSPACRSDYAAPSFSRQQNTMYEEKAPAGTGAGTAPSGARRKGARGRGSGNKKGNSGRRNAKPVSRPRSWLIIALAAALAGVVILILCLTGVLMPKITQTVTYVKGGPEQDRDAVNNYNMGYSSYIFRYASEYEMPPAFVAAVIRNESSYDSKAENAHTHARGLMQLMSATAQDEAKRLKIENFTLDMLFDPGTNIRMGTHYLHWISVNYFRDDYILIICSYHAGQGNVKSWISKYSTDGKTLTLDQIPTSDTRTYATRVMRDFAIYQNHIYNAVCEDMIRVAAARHGLPGALVAAVVKAGSLYDETAVYYDRWRTDTFRNGKLNTSETAEHPRYGLMQLSPEMICAATGAEIPDRASMTEGEKNLDIGCGILSDLLTLYGGDRVTALCAYRTDVEQTNAWIAAAGEGRTTLTITDIPEEYSYVREYIKEVEESYAAYRPFYQD
ncbi:MAG: hypothetical protein CW338_04155 [Clostridiales bacterium]|nr:hypothetical protein [Clostridiales bacterium]